MTLSTDADYEGCKEKLISYINSSDHTLRSHVNPVFQDLSQMKVDVSGGLEEYERELGQTRQHVPDLLSKLRWEAQVCRGYELGRQDVIREGIKGLEQLRNLYPNKLLVETQDIMLVHGISPRKQDDSGSWVGSPITEWLSPRDYTERILTVLQHGLRPTLRDWSMTPFRFNEKHALKRVYFFDLADAGNSSYGYVNVCFSTKGKYAVISVGHAEYIVLAKENIREEFSVLFDIKFIGDKTAHKSETYKLLIPKLQELGIPFREIH